MKPNYPNERNGTTRNLNGKIKKNIFESMIIDKIIYKANESNSSRTILKLTREPEEIVENPKKILSEKYKFHSDDTKLIKINTEGDKNDYKKGNHQTSQSLIYYLPAITQITPKRKYPIIKYGTVDKIKKVENLFKTEMRIRENIKRSINHKSIDLDYKTEICNSEKNKIEEKLKFQSIEEPINIVNAIYASIKTNGSYSDSNHNEIQVRRIPKKNPLKLIRRKNDYNSINGKISFPSIINDNQLMCRIFNENMSQVNKQIVSRSNNKDKQNNFDFYK